jgi:anti-sigma-K factor RskA
MSHNEASELLGAYALDAVDGDEFDELEEHLVGCPRCRAELDGLREVAAALGNTVETPPESLWSGIASRLPERDADAEAPPMPTLDSEDRSPFRAAVPDRRRHRGAVATVVGFAVAAAAVAAVLGIGLVRADDKVSNLQSGAAHPPSGAQQALSTPGHYMVQLASNGGVTLADFVVVPDGRGYLVSSMLPSLGGARTYQLWGTVGTRTISLGLLGSAPRQATFTMAGSRRPSRLSITAEPAGGVVAPTGAVVATGTV